MLNVLFLIIIILFIFPKFYVVCFKFYGFMI